MRVLFSILLVVFCVGTSHARDVTLAWYASTSAGVNGYIVYVGTASGVYTDPGTDVGNVLTYVVTGLADNTPYYFVATAYNRRSITNGGVAVDVGNGTVGVPSVGHLMSGYYPLFSNTVNYNGHYTVASDSPADQMNITATYVSETFGSDDIAFAESGHSNEVCVSCTMSIIGITIGPGITFQ
jgi:hypothetical protein